MAAPILNQNRSRVLSIFSGRLELKLRSLLTLQKCLAGIESSHRKKSNLVEQSPHSSGNSKGAIEIPYKIERSSTAILEALAKTVKSDVNQPIYQSIDDPALLSRSDGLLKNHLAALDNGRKAAQAMIAKNPEYYTHFWDEPLPKGMDKSLSGYQHEGPSEAALLERIEARNMTDAIELYKIIKSHGEELSQIVLEKLLDLLTVFIHQEPNDQSEITNFISPQFDLDSPFPVVTWKKGNIAEEIFHSMSNKSSRAYCSIICGMAQNYDKEQAMLHYREARDANVPLDTLTYNKLLAIVSLDMESMEDIVKEIEFILKDMASSSVSPNVETFNSVLKNCRRISRWRGTKQYALSVLAEMRACGIEPSLGTWTEILNIFYYHKDKSPRRPELFEDMLNLIEGKSFEAQGPRDVYFFRTAMRVLFTHLPDSRLALRLHEVLKTGRNFDLIGPRQLRYAYFKELLLLISPVEPTDTVMEIYNSVVPYIFMPQVDVYMSIFENIETFDTYHYIPQICADIDGSNFYNDKGAIPLFSLMANKRQDFQLQTQFCDIASAFLKRWEENKMNRVSPYLDGSIIGNMLKIFLSADKLDEAKSALQLYRENPKLQEKDPSDDSLQALVEAFISSNDFQSTKDLLTFMSNLECENVPVLVTRALDCFKLSDQERNYLNGLVQGKDLDFTSDSD